MTLIIELPEALEEALSNEADALGLALPEYALHLLAMRQRVTSPFSTGRELVEHWQREQVAGAWADVSDSQQLARDLRRQAETR